MRDDAKERAGKAFALRRVSRSTATERLMREEGMARALKNGAKPYRDAAGKERHIPFKEANLAPVEPWLRDPKARRGYRRVQELRRVAGQLIGQPGDKIEIAKRLGALHWEQGSDIEGAARCGLYDAIWSREHVYDSFTVPRRTGRTLIDTGRVAAVAEEEARKIQAEDPQARGGFWVRDRNDFGLLYVVPNADPAEQEIAGGEGENVLLGQVSALPVPPLQTPQGSTASGNPATPAQAIQSPATAGDYFAQLRQNLAPREGGLANRPPHEDRGGETNKGVTQATLDGLHKHKAKKYGHYPHRPSKLTDAQIDTILRDEFFDPLHVWEIVQVPGLLTLAPELPEQLFDIGILHGPGDAGVFLQEALYEVLGIDLRVVKNGRPEYDGIIGPVTRRALAQAIAAGKIVEINNLIVDKRKAKMNGLKEKAWNRGWFSRAESFRISRPSAPSSPR